MIEEGLTSLLLASNQLQQLVGDRIYPVLVPESSPYPCISYQTISEVSDNTSDGPSGYVDRRIQVDAWGKSYPDVRHAQDAVRQAIEGFSGTLSDGTVVMSVRSVNSFDGFESDARIYRSSADYIVTFLQ